MRIPDKLTNRDVIVCLGQSNMGHYGEALSAYPQRDRFDPGVTFCNAYAASGEWVALRDCQYSSVSNGIWNTYGSLPHRIAARMRDRGMLPAIELIYIGGCTAHQLNTDLLTSASWLGARLAQLVRSTVRAIIWCQGENEASTSAGDYTEWRAYTEDSVARVRAVVGATVPLILIQLPTSYSPQLAPPALDHLTEMRSEMAALVAADANSTLYDPGALLGTVDGIHWTAASRGIHAKAIAALL